MGIAVCGAKSSKYLADPSDGNMAAVVVSDRSRVVGGNLVVGLGGNDFGDVLPDVRVKTSFASLNFRIAMRLDRSGNC